MISKAKFQNFSDDAHFHNTFFEKKTNNAGSKNFNIVYKQFPAKSTARNFGEKKKDTTEVVMHSILFVCTSNTCRTPMVNEPFSGYAVGFVLAVNLTWHFTGGSFCQKMVRTEQGLCTCFHRVFMSSFFDSFDYFGK
jgi:hypothetical protein